MKKLFAMCIGNKGYPASLEVRKVYRVLIDVQASRHGRRADLQPLRINYDPQRQLLPLHELRLDRRSLV